MQERTLKLSWHPKEFLNYFEIIPNIVYALLPNANKVKEKKEKCTN
jgi:hypothetical protein